MTMYIAIALAVGYPLLALWQIRGRKFRDRLDLLIVLTVGFLFLFLARATADWQSLPPWLWLVGLVLMAAATAYSGWAWPQLPWLKSEHPGRRAVSAAIQLFIAAALLALLV
ncbi:hypothetical protein [Kribbella sp. CA-293567]|uniref:hypothetical protein n=1 Tax=Kribbella sp. CA-293567 TaxID=3002436 RepID=UPI0022DD6E9F|nr:hypothetical protein [Kribbella sp. CA-293567]WBQ04714.1 hypothetical protein OX958_32730 [Kribbella sp. CA-293567]